MTEQGHSRPGSPSPDPGEHTAESGDDFRFLVEAVNDGIAVVGPDTGLLYVNPQLASMLGVGRGEALGVSVLDFVVPEDVSRIAQFHQARTSGQAAPDRYETRVISRTGKARVLEVRPRLSLWKGQQVTLAVLRDITERIDVQARLAEEQKLTNRLREEIGRREEVEAALRSSESRYRNLLEGTNLIIVQLDSQGRFRFANTAAGRSVGIRPEDLVGRRMDEVFPPEIARQNVASIARALGTGRPVIDQGLYDVQGGKRWFEARVLPLSHQDAADDEVLVVIDEIHERKMAEARILAYQEKLRALAAELSLTEQRERRRIAVELHDRIGQQLALCRIRLGTLRGALGEAASAGILEEVREALDVTIRDTRTLTFELSPPVLHELGLPSALEWLVEEFGRRSPIRIEFRDDNLPKPLEQDLRDLMFQSARELLVNAIKHSGAGSISIEVRRSGELIEIAVTDDGVGFEPGADPADARTPSGFGLFSIRERLAAYGGLLVIDRAAGGGTEALLRAPAVRERAEPLVDRPAALEAGGGEPS